MLLGESILRGGQIPEQNIRINCSTTKETLRIVQRRGAKSPAWRVWGLTARFSPFDPRKAAFGIWSAGTCHRSGNVGPPASATVVHFLHSTALESHCSSRALLGFSGINRTGAQGLTTAGACLRGAMSTTRPRISRNALVITAPACPGGMMFPLAANARDCRGMVRSCRSEPEAHRVTQASCEGALREIMDRFWS